MERKVLLEEVSKAFPLGAEDVEVLRNVSLEINNAEFISLLGPSGCGKSTILNLISESTSPDAGQVSFHGSGENKVSYMPQKDLLLPWRKVIDNVCIPLEIQGIKKQDARKKAGSMMGLFGLEGFEESYPAQLSGGMRQRAALLRTFLHQGDILLLDEPFGKLDALTRSNLQQWLLGVWEEFLQSVLFVTHDIDEAIFLSDRIYVMSGRPGTIKAEIKVDLPRPRNLKMLTTQSFMAQKNQILELLDEK